MKTKRMEYSIDEILEESKKNSAVNFYHSLLLFLIFTSIIPIAHGQPAVTIDNLAVTVESGLSVTVQGDFQNQNGGTIDNGGTINVSGNWTNNASNTVFST